MNSIVKKILLIGYVLLLPACVHYPQRYSYYSDHDAYNSGYIMHRNHYGERPNHHDSGYGRGSAYFPSHQRNDQHNSRYGHYDNDGNNRQHDDYDSIRHNFGRRSYH